VVAPSANDAKRGQNAAIGADLLVHQTFGVMLTVLDGWYYE